MTVDEYRHALERLSPEQFDMFMRRWGGADATVDACVQAYTYSLEPDRWERIAVFQLRSLGADVQTEQEKGSGMSRTQRGR